MQSTYGRPAQRNDLTRLWFRQAIPKADQCCQKRCRPKNAIFDVFDDGTILRAGGLLTYGDISILHSISANGRKRLQCRCFERRLQLCH